MLNFLINVSKDATYTCGGVNGIEIPGMLPKVTATVVLIIEVFVPIALVIFGMLDLGKAVIAQKEDEIKKGQATFIKRLFAAVLVFFVIFIVKLLIGFISDDKSVMSCFDCFVNGNVDDNSCKLKAGSFDPNTIGG